MASKTSLPKNAEISSIGEQVPEAIALQITINEKAFSAKLYDNDSTKISGTTANDYSDE